ncbi:xanthine dehydrogenase accessory protein XdhC [Mycobacterium sp. 852013-50091_SCH5140682]|uniref:xanthine dehydrogenase accessory protein XdhC n=1 Tax=Mycobacterium sp. 852013-50091_SCH5140682 TaxID=1834109 RepID=UPI0007E982EB|nr:xanthine dehydrogenase accessory protein XdhC [Mycobacterium sp. 852013-50091_SCH5140682]OBC14217.1 xanthine dehydrogenase accessory protein XdhC [Mycobacterium sp. 852013-50091_SCH5140682]
MHWLDVTARLRAQRVPAVLVTLLAVRGHAPREAGAKMVVSADNCWGSIGGGNLEESALVAARDLLASGTRELETRTWGLTERAPARHGVQCCGGEVSVLFEPLPAVPAVAIFGMGHVGSELARILARHDIELHLVDSRARHVEPERLAPLLADAEASVHTHHAVVPELVLGELPAGCHVLLMTHDHAEDAALCDAALRCGHLGSIGLIGSSAKWRRFAKRLAEEGHDEATAARITTPIGLRGITGKEPATIAVSVAADLVLRFQCERPAGIDAAEATR